MTLPISAAHKRRFEEIKKRLSELGNTENNFVQVELLFFEAITISKEYGDDVHTNPLLAALKQLQHGEYEKTQMPTQKINQRQAFIRYFIVAFKKVLSVSN